MAFIFSDNDFEEMKAVREEMARERAQKILRLKEQLSYYEDARKQREKLFFETGDEDCLGYPRAREIEIPIIDRLRKLGEVSESELYCNMIPTTGLDLFALRLEDRMLDDLCRTRDTRIAMLRAEASFWKEACNEAELLGISASHAKSMYRFVTRFLDRYLLGDYVVIEDAELSKRYPESRCKRDIVFKFDI